MGNQTLNPLSSSFLYASSPSQENVKAIPTPPPLPKKSEMSGKVVPSDLPLPLLPPLLRPATEPEVQRLMQLYLQRPVPSFEVQSVEVVQNARLRRQFRAKMASLQRSGGGAPPREWNAEPEGHTFRRSVFQHFQDLALPYSLEIFPSVHFMPLWYRVSNIADLRGILESGYASRSCLTSQGGQGVSVGYEAEYAWRAQCHCSSNLSSDESSGEILILNWVGLRSVYPVTSDDNEALLHPSSQFQAYDGLFIPVVPCANEGGERASSFFRPTLAGEAAAFTEVCVLDPTQCLPTFVIRLRPSSLLGGADPTPVRFEVSDECLSDFNFLDGGVILDDHQQASIPLTKANLERQEELLLLERMDELLGEKSKSKG